MILFLTKAKLIRLNEIGNEVSRLDRYLGEFLVRLISSDPVQRLSQTPLTHPDRGCSCTFAGKWAPFAQRQYKKERIPELLRPRRLLPCAHLPRQHAQEDGVQRAREHGPGQRHAIGVRLRGGVGCPLVGHDLKQER